LNQQHWIYLMPADMLLLLVVLPHCLWTACTLVLPAGLLPALAESCTYIAAAVRLASNEHRLPYMILATALLSLWRRVVLQWPDSSQQQQQQQPLLCSQLQPTLQPAIALAAAILSTAGPAATAAAAAAATAAAAVSDTIRSLAESGSSLMDMKTSRMELLQYAAPVEATDYAVRAADVIVTAILSWLDRLEGSNEQQQQRQLAPLLSQDLLLVVVSRFATECAQLYHLTELLRGYVIAAAAAAAVAAGGESSSSSMYRCLPTMSSC
jgi:hypothetical protein